MIPNIHWSLVKWIFVWMISCAIGSSLKMLPIGNWQLSLGPTSRKPCDFTGDFWWWIINFRRFLSGKRKFSASQILFARGCTKNDYNHPDSTNRIRIQRKSENLLLEDSLDKWIASIKKTTSGLHFKFLKQPIYPEYEKVSGPFRNLVELQPEENGLCRRRSRSVALSAIATPPRTTTSQRCPRRPAGKQKTNGWIFVKA